MSSTAGPLLDYSDWAIVEEIEMRFESWSWIEKKIGGYEW